MKLNESPFKRIKSSEKRIEIRLFDEKRSSLNIGDTITFFKLPNLEKQLQVKVIGLLRYSTFYDLVRDFPMSFFGHSESYSKEEFVESIYKIYSREQEKLYGVLGIRIKLIQ